MAFQKRQRFTHDIGKRHGLRRRDAIGDLGEFQKAVDDAAHPGCALAHMVGIAGQFGEFAALKIVRDHLGEHGQMAQRCLQIMGYGRRELVQCLVLAAQFAGLCLNPLLLPLGLGNVTADTDDLADALLVEDRNRRPELPYPLAVLVLDADLQRLEGCLARIVGDIQQNRRLLRRTGDVRQKASDQFIGRRADEAGIFVIGEADDVVAVETHDHVRQDLQQREIFPLLGLERRLGALQFRDVDAQGDDIAGLGHMTFPADPAALAELEDGAPAARVPVACEALAHHRLGLRRPFADARKQARADIGAHDALQAHADADRVARFAAPLPVGAVEHDQALLGVEDRKSLGHRIERGGDALAEQDLFTVAASAEETAQEQRIGRAVALARHGDHMCRGVECAAIVVAEAEIVGVFTPAGRATHQHCCGVVALDDNLPDRYPAIAVPAEGSAGRQVAGNESRLGIDDDGGKRKIVVKCRGKAGHPSPLSAWRSHGQTRPFPRFPGVTTRHRVNRRAPSAGRPRQAPQGRQVSARPIRRSRTPRSGWDCGR